MKKIVNAENQSPACYLKQKISTILIFFNSWIIGDKETDIEAANLAGITNTILVRSGQLIDESNSNSKFIVDSIKQFKEVIKT